MFVKEVVEDSNINFEKLIKKYKSDYLGKEIFSSTTVLYSSACFDKLMSPSFENNPNKYFEKNYPYGKVGRNNLCPCGSGKKYKKCCL
jgi:uncharacterized protein YchJ